MKALTTAASSGPRSSCRKWPPPSIVVCGWPSVPGMRDSRALSAPPVMGSWSLNAHRNGFVQADSVSQALRFAGAAGSVSYTHLTLPTILRV